MFGIGAYGQRMPDRGQALPGRATPLPLHDRHAVLGRPLTALPAGLREAFFAMGCFWGAERVFWSLPGVYTTAVGTPAATRPTPPTARCAAGRPAMPKSCAWSMTPRQRPSRRC